MANDTITRLNVAGHLAEAVAKPAAGWGGYEIGGDELWDLKQTCLILGAFTHFSASIEGDSGLTSDEFHAIVSSAWDNLRDVLNAVEARSASARKAEATRPASVGLDANDLVTMIRVLSGQTVDSPIEVHELLPARIEKAAEVEPEMREVLAQWWGAPQVARYPKELRRQAAASAEVASAA